MQRGCKAAHHPATRQRCDAHGRGHFASELEKRGRRANALPWRRHDKRHARRLVAAVLLLVLVLLRALGCFGGRRLLPRRR